MANILFEQGDHRCIAFNDLVRGEDGVQANQFLIQHGDKSALLDPGGALLYTPLSMAVSQFTPPQIADLYPRFTPGSGHHRRGGSLAAVHRCQGSLLETLGPFRAA